MVDPSRNGRVQPGGGASTAELVQRAAQQISTLVRDELAAKGRRAGVGGAAASLRTSVRDADLRATVRRPVPLAAVGAVLVLAGVIIWMARRRRA